MRIIYSKKVNGLFDEIEPYLNISLDGTTFKENTPNEIKEKYKLWRKLSNEEERKAKEILEYE